MTVEGSKVQSCVAEGIARVYVDLETASGEEEALRQRQDVLLVEECTITSTGRRQYQGEGCGDDAGLEEGAGEKGTRRRWRKR